MEKLMKKYQTLALSLLTGALIGGGVIHALHAQSTPSVYVVAEIDVQNVEAYTREYVPRAQALIKSMGGKFLAAGQKVTQLEGDPPKTRVAVQVWPSMDKVQEWQKSAELKELRMIVKDYAKFRVFAVEGLPQ
jgi:uncharacterized protein (DUF1330 family)